MVSGAYRPCTLPNCLKMLVIKKDETLLRKNKAQKKGKILRNIQEVCDLKLR